MALQIDGMEVGEDDFIAFVLDQIIERRGLPIRGGIPVFQHDHIDKL